MNVGDQIECTTTIYEPYLGRGAVGVVANVFDNGFVVIGFDEPDADGTPDERQHLLSPDQFRKVN